MPTSSVIEPEIRPVHTRSLARRYGATVAAGGGDVAGRRLNDLVLGD